MRKTSPGKKVAYTSKRSEGSRKAWETIRKKQADRTGKFKALAKQVAAIVKDRQWESEKIKHLKEASRKAALNTCVNCGDNRPYVLHKHHVEPEGGALVMLCANCHDVVRRAGLKELKEARDRAKWN